MVDTSYSNAALKTTKNLDHLRPDFLRFVCFRKGCKLDFDSRIVYSAVCDLWFRSKRLPSERTVRAVTSLDGKTVQVAVATLREAGLLDEWKPLYVADTFYEKLGFDLKKWWKGIQTRSVHRTTTAVNRKTADGTKKEVVVRGAKADVIVAFLLYAEGRKKSLTTAYLAAATGIPPRTVRRQLDALDAAEKVRRGPNGELTLLAPDPRGGKPRPLYEVNYIRVADLLKGLPPEHPLHSKLMEVGMKDFSKFERKHQVMTRANVTGDGRPNYHHLASLVGIR